MNDHSPQGTLSVRRNWRSQAIALAVPALLLALVGCSHHDEPPKQTHTATAHDVTLSKAQLQHIRMYTVKSSSFHQSIDTTGVVDFDNDQATAVLAPFSGPLSKLLVSIGDTVKKGQALALVESPDFAEAISNYRTARASARTARRVADRNKDMLQHQGISEREAEQAETDATAAEAERDAALQALVALNVGPATLKAIRNGQRVRHITGTIRAPISGTIVDRLVTPGQLLQAGSTPCFTVADLSKVWVQAQIFSSDITAVRVGDSATVESGIADKDFSGTLTNIGAAVDTDNRSVPARVEVDNPHGFLKKQMYVRVHIHSQQESTGILLPVSAILRDDENLPFVYVEQPDGGFARRSVRLGDRVGKRRNITHGLHQGDMVVVDGAIFVQFMQIQ